MSVSRELSGLCRMCLLVLLTLALLLLSGCVTSEGGPVGELRRAADQAQSAVATVEDSFSQYRRGGTLGTVAETTTEDMLSQLEKTQKQVFELSVDIPAEDRQRAAVLEEITDAARAITSAEDLGQDPANPPRPRAST